MPWYAFEMSLHLAPCCRNLVALMSSIANMCSESLFGRNSTSATVHTRQFTELSVPVA